MIDLRKVTSFVQSTTARLALSYLAIIMLMSIGFSGVFFYATDHELHRPGPGPNTSQSQQFDSRPRFARNSELETILKQRAEEGHRALLQRLIILNILALLSGSALSYYLARRTLDPIEQNMEAQAQFVSDASHELRTPLTALQTTNEVALRKLKLSSDEAKELLRHNVAEVTKLQALTTGLLKLAKSDTSDIVRTPISLQAVASDTMNTFIPAAQSKRISIEENVPNISVLGDMSSLSQTLGILLDNAIKYSPAGSTITLSGSHGNKTGLISVDDTGQGIAAKDLPHIFDRFYRADQSRGKHKVDGYGIGLSLAKKLVHQIDGEIIVSSTEGKGSTFSIRLPLA